MRWWKIDRNNKMLVLPSTEYTNIQAMKREHGKKTTLTCSYTESLSIADTTVNTQLTMMRTDIVHDWLENCVTNMGKHALERSYATNDQIQEEKADNW